MDTSKFASTFAPYTPPPDEPPSPGSSSPQPSTFPRLKRTWFPPAPPAQPSYQSGAVPTFGTAHAGPDADAEAPSAAQMWETRFGWRVDVCAAAAYLGGPLAALLLLILETANDYVRFHAYQSALLTAPLLLLRIFAAFIFPGWLQTILTLVLVGAEIGMAARAYRDASLDLSRYELPYIGEIAERWLGEE